MKQRVNMDIDKDLWKQASVKAAQLGVTKKKLVEMGIKKILQSEDHNGKK